MAQPATMDFDVQKLVQVGFDQKQAEVLLRTFDFKMKNFLAQHLDEALTKQSEQIRLEMVALFKEFRQETQFEIKNVHHALSSEISNLRVEMTGEIASIRTESQTGIASLRTMLAEKVNTIFLQTSALVTLAVAIISAVIVFA